MGVGTTAPTLWARPLSEPAEASGSARPRLPSELFKTSLLHSGTCCCCIIVTDFVFTEFLITGIAITDLHVRCSSTFLIAVFYVLLVAFFVLLACFFLLLAGFFLLLAGFCVLFA